MNKKIKKISHLLLFFVATVQSLFYSKLVNAQDGKIWDSIEGQLKPIERVYDGRPQDPRAIAALIIQVLMGFIGIIFLIMIIYGGFVWMTAGGNDDRVNKAKKIISQGTIGIAILITAYALTKTVIATLTCATGPAGQMCLFFHNL